MKCGDTGYLLIWIISQMLSYTKKTLNVICKHEQRHLTLNKTKRALFGIMKYNRGTKLVREFDTGFDRKKYTFLSYILFKAKEK